jgi:hypothetical protein
MESLGGMTRTGNKTAGPASDLVELEDAKGLKHTAICFHRKFRDHATLTADLSEIVGFLQRPDVCDLLEIVERVPEAGAFVYPTGTAIPLAEVLETLHKMGEAGGVRAGLELCFHVAQILQDAYVKGEPFGIYSHGDLSPWRVLLKPDGQVRLIGFALPQVEVLMAHESDKVTLKEDSYRYCPPERIEGEDEDFTADLYSLVLMGFELIIGEPLFAGGLSDVKQQATNAQGPYRLYQYRERLPESVLELFSRCLKFDIDARYSDINEFIWEVRDTLALPEIDGPSLGDVAGRVAARIKRRRAGSGPAAGDDASLEGPIGVPIRKEPEPEPETEAEQAARWGRVSRSGGRDVRRSGAAPEPSGREGLRDRLGRSSGSAPPPVDDPKAALRDRLRRSSGEAARPAAAPDPKEALRDRLRGSSSTPDTREAPRERLRSSSGGAAPDAKEALRDRLRGSSGGAAPDPKEAVRDRLRGSSGPGAASDPRERLRSSTAPSAAPPAPAPPSAGDALRERLRGSSAPPSAAEPAKERLGRSGSDAAASGDRASLRDSLRDRLRASRGEEPPAEEAPRAGRAASLLSRLRSSKGGSGADAEPPSGGGGLELRIDGLPTVTVQPDPGQAIAELAWRALEACGGPPVSLSGELEGWFSVEQGDEAFDGAAPVRRLDASRPVRLRFVAAKRVPCAFEVAGRPGVALRSDVSTAMTAGAVLAAVRESLELGDGGWHLTAGGEPLHALQPIGEVVGKNPLTVVVTK